AQSPSPRYFGVLLGIIEKEALCTVTRLGVQLSCFAIADSVLDPGGFYKAQRKSAAMYLVESLTSWV
ncbi:hypothetical protein BGZ94_004128, partial [Podila epigama]